MKRDIPTPSVALVQAVAVTAELCGRTFSEAAARMFVEDLSGFPEQAVLAALSRCRKEVRGMLTVQDVVSRIDDGRPGPDEAWAQMPRDEAASIVWTDEMAESFSVASRLLQVGDKVGARLAFREAYIAKVAAARDERRKPRWTVSLGHDAAGRDAALADAVQRNRLTFEQARGYSPTLLLQGEPPAPVLRLVDQAVRRLPAADPEPVPESVVASRQEAAQAMRAKLLGDRNV